MRIYTYHMAPGRTALADAVAVPEGFSWGALFFGFVWALFRRLWVAAAAAVVAPFAIGLATWSFAGGAPAVGGGLLLVFALFFASHANDWRRDRLGRDGHLLAGIAAGRTRAEADRRFFAKTALGAHGPPPL